MNTPDTFKVDDNGELVRLLLSDHVVFALSHAEWARLVRYEAARLGMTGEWAEVGDGTPASPVTWTRGAWKIEKHPLTDKYMVLHGGGLASIEGTLAAAKAVIEIKKEEQA